MGVLATFQQYREDGTPISGSEISLPEFLDWMPIPVKVHWFLYMGQGDAETKYVLFRSQGEQRLITNVTLSPLDPETYKERRNGAQREIDRFIDEKGYNRTPRNQ